MMNDTVDLEDRRLAKLTSLSGRIRDHMRMFQPIADRAKVRFGVPIALVSVIDANDQIYVGNCGIAATSCPREQTFCTYTIMSSAVMIVEDTLQNAQFRDHPFVTGGPKLRFYAGAPVTFPGDLRIGTVCLADSRPRSFSKGDMMVLEHLAALVVHKLASIPEGRSDSVANVVIPIQGVTDPGERIGVRAWKKKSA